MTKSLPYESLRYFDRYPARPINLIANRVLEGLFRDMRTIEPDEIVGVHSAPCLVRRAEGIVHPVIWKQGSTYVGIDYTFPRLSIGVKHVPGAHAAPKTDADRIVFTTRMPAGSSPDKIGMPAVRPMLVTAEEEAYFRENLPKHLGYAMLLTEVGPRHSEHDPPDDGRSVSVYGVDAAGARTPLWLPEIAACSFVAQLSRVLRADIHEQLRGDDGPLC